MIVQDRFGKQVAGIYRYKVGDFEVTSLNDGFAKIAKLDAMVINAPLTEIERAVTSAFVSPSNVLVPFNPLLVNTGRNLVLFDAGFGDNGSDMTGRLFGNMAAAGIDPNAIDTVVISHCHGDHISGLRSRSGMPLFPNAQVMVPASEWDYWNDRSQMDNAPPGVWRGYFENFHRVFDAVAKDVVRFDYGKEIVPGIVAVDARGHSPGQSAFIISSGSDAMMYTADIASYPIIFARHPEWLGWADQIPDQALTTRRRLLDMLSADRMMMTGYHYPFPGVGYISKTNTGYDFLPAQWLPLL